MAVPSSGSGYQQHQQPLMHYPFASQSNPYINQNAPPLSEARPTSALASCELPSHQNYASQVYSQGLAQVVAKKVSLGSDPQILSLHPPSQQISPTNSSSSSSSLVLSSPIQSQSSSPTSTRSFYTPPPPPPHLRSLKKPLYRPAVLRYGTSLKVNGLDWSHQLFYGQVPPVSGAPKRSHWMLDDATEDCLQCKKVFTFWDRRHHCRRCGLIFCYLHSSHLLRLDQNCNFHPSGTLSRTCDKCAKDYNRSVVAAVNSKNNDGTVNAIDNINRINNMISNGNKAQFPGAADEQEYDVMVALAVDGGSLYTAGNGSQNSSGVSSLASEHSFERHFVESRGLQEPAGRLSAQPGCVFATAGHDPGLLTANAPAKFAKPAERRKEGSCSWQRASRLELEYV